MPGTLRRPHITFAVALLLTARLPAQPTIGANQAAGCLENPHAVSRLQITQPGIFENFLVDGGGASGNLVKITADNVTLRNCEIRNGSGNGIGVFGNRVVIENCRIHHMLASTFQEQHDAHGISGRWGETLIRNCDIGYTSGDSIQFDPDRVSSGTAVIEQCTLWTAPLPVAAGGFHAGERPGENAVDTKTKPDGQRCKLVVRKCYLHGWNQPGQISNMAALNLKERVDAEVTDCIFRDNEIAFRVRGPGKRGGARVTIVACAIYQADIGVRAEEGIELLKISGLAFGETVKQRIRFVDGQATAGFSSTGERTAPPLEVLLERGFR